MEKLLIEVHSPAANIVHDIFVPINMQIGEIIQLIGRMFAQLSGGTFLFTGKGVLSERESGYIFDPNQQVKNSRLRNGTKLILY